MRLASIIRMMLWSSIHEACCWQICFESMYKYYIHTQNPMLIGLLRSRTAGFGSLLMRFEFHAWNCLARVVFVFPLPWLPHYAFAKGSGTWLSVEQSGLRSEVSSCGMVSHLLSGDARTPERLQPRRLSWLLTVQAFVLDSSGCDTPPMK